MNYRELLFSVLMICLFVQCKMQQYNVGSSRNGKCYAKCLYIDKVVIEIEEYAEYTGDVNNENVEVVQKEIVIQPATTKWEKKMADRNCLSPNPEDCLVWCLVEVKPIVRTVTVLADTTQSPNYKIETVEREVERIKGRSFEWKEVLCEQEVTPTVINEIQSALKANRYYDGAISGQLDLETREAMREFQKHNNLPIGQFDLETLDALGVIIKI